MIRTTHTPQLSSAKPRGGLQSVGTLLPRLIDYYEQQAEANSRLATSAESNSGSESRLQQSTFAFYE